MKYFIVFLMISAGIFSSVSVELVNLDILSEDFIWDVVRPVCFTVLLVCFCLCIKIEALSAGQKVKVLIILGAMLMASAISYFYVPLKF